MQNTVEHPNQVFFLQCFENEIFTQPTMKQFQMHSVFSFICFCEFFSWTIVTWIPSKLVIPSCFISWKTHFLMLAGSGSYQKMTRAVNQSQFTPKMKANAVSRLLSSLVWIDQYHECNRLTALILFWENTVAVNIRKLVFSLNKTWRN